MSDYGLVQCRHPFSLTLKDGSPLVVSHGAIYAETDPVVLGHEAFFEDVLVRSSTSRGRPLTSITGEKVETATATPGSRRRMSKSPDSDKSQQPGNMSEV